MLLKSMYQAAVFFVRFVVYSRKAKQFFLLTFGLELELPFAVAFRGFLIKQDGFFC